MKFNGKVIKYGDNVDTDVIIPARYLNTIDKKELASHCMEDIDRDFTKKVELGDIITVRGAMATYNGNRQINEGSTAVIVGYDPTYDVINEYTVAEALLLPDNTNLMVRGTVISIDTEYSIDHNNICVTIQGDDGSTLYVYRLRGYVEVGDKILITGHISTYEGNRQIASGATFEYVI